MLQANLSLPVPIEWSQVATVEKLTIFPIKSFMGIEVDEAEVLVDQDVIFEHFY
jgi:hypothetical protein